MAGMLGAPLLSETLGPNVAATENGISEMRNKARRDKILVVFQNIDAIAEQAIREELDMQPLTPGELCPLRAIVDICIRAKDTIHNA